MNYAFLYVQKGPTLPSGQTFGLSFGTKRLIISFINSKSSQRVFAF